MSAAPPTLLTLLTLGLLSGCVTVVEPTAGHAQLRAAEVIVVLGNRPPVGEDGRIAPEPERRMLRGVELFRAGLAPKLLFTGGRDGEGRVEAEVMRDAAIAQGVPSDAIWVEGASTDTITNARNSVRLLCEGRNAPCEPDIILVSAPTHVDRARALFRCAGARVQVSASANPPSRSARCGARAHELFTRFLYVFIDECGRAGSD